MEPKSIVVRIAGSARGHAPGAEIVGTVVDWQGQPGPVSVVVPRILPCGECDACRRGLISRCPNQASRVTSATEQQVPAHFVCPLTGALALPDDLPLWQLAALPDAAGTPYGAMARIGVGPSELLVVIGDGARALCALAIARAKGAQVIVLSEGSFDFASHGAARTLRYREVDELSRLANELGCSFATAKAIETTGAFAARKAAVQPDVPVLALLDGGADRLSDRATDPLPIDLASARWHDRLLISCNGCHPDLIPELVAMAIRRELPLAEVSAPGMLEIVRPG